MIDRSIVEVVFLDHSYCVPNTFGKEIKKTESNFVMDKSGETLSWEEAMGIQFDPPPSEPSLACSALSPSHSVDSGCDNDLNLFGELGFDLDSIESLFVPERDNGSKELSQKIQPESTVKCSSTSTRSSTKPLPSPAAKSRKRSAKDSIDEYDKNRKNAIAARENRQKKKKYIESIENENKELKRENEILSKKEKYHLKTVEKLENQVTYLKNVISNQSTLTPLLKRLASTPGVSFISSLTEQEPQKTSTADMDEDEVDEDDNDMNKEKKRCKRRRKEARSGICLHVDKNQVSLELCDQCSIKAQGKGHA